MTAPISQITVYSNASVLGSTLVTVGTFPVDNSSQRSATLRGENCVKICFKAGHSIAIPAFSFIEYDGQLFFLKETYRPVPKGNSYYEYNMKFVSFDNMLSKPQAYRKVVVDGETWNEPDIDVVGNLADIATIIKDSIIETAGRYEGVFADMLSKVELVNAEININSESKAFSYSGQKISQVLDAIANEYEIDYWFEQVGDTQNGITKMILHFAKCEILSGDLHVTDKTSPSNPFDKLHPTVSGGLDECTFSNEWSGVVQRITPFGSERNIKRGQAIANDMFVSFGKRLRLEYDHSCTIDGTTYQHAYAVKNEDGDLEPLYVDENGAVYVPGVTTGEEDIKKYDDIYPRGHFRVTHVTQRGVDTQIYTVYAIPTVERNGQFVDLTNAEIDAMQADPTKKLFPIDIADGQTLSLHFETGYLNGREFEVANKTAKMTWNGSAYEVDPDNGHWVACFEINPEGDNNDSPQVPYGNLIPRGKFDSATGYEGDMFAIFNMDMPAFYVEDAQNELAQKAYDEIVSILATRPEVKCKGNEVYFKNHSLFLGQRIFVKSDLFGQDNQGQPLEFISRVTNYSHPLSKPNNVDFRLCSSRVQGAISVMKGAIADQTNDIMGVGQTARSLSRRAFRDAQEMIGMLQAIVAEMMVVGVERNQFQFTMGIECLKATGSDGIMHFDGLKITAGELQHTQEPYIKDAWEGHYSLLSETTLKVDHNGNAIDKSATDTYRNTPYYLYAVINSSTGQVSMELWADKKDGENDEAYLLLGILSSEFLDGNTSLRVFNRSNGFTQIAGGTITTEQLQDPTRQLIIDMSSNPPRIIAKRGAQIIGNITFISSNGTEKPLGSTIDTMEEEINKEIGGENLYTGVDPLRITKESGSIGVLLEDGKKYVVSVQSVSGTATDNRVRLYEQTEDGEGTVTHTLIGTIEVADSGMSYTVVEGHGGELELRCSANMTGKYYDMSGIMVQQGEKPTTYHAGYLAKALERDATKEVTSIDGGLLLSALIKLAQGGVVRAGMSGLADYGQKTIDGQTYQSEGVGFWAGSDYVDALMAACGIETNTLPPVFLSKTGYRSRIGCFRVIDKETVAVVTDQSTIYVTNKSIDDVTEIQNSDSEYLDGGRSIEDDNTDSGTDITVGSAQLTIAGDGKYHIVVPMAEVYAEARVLSNPAQPDVFPGQADAGYATAAVSASIYIRILNNGTEIYKSSSVSVSADNFTDDGQQKWEVERDPITGYKNISRIEIDRELTQGNLVVEIKASYSMSASAYDITSVHSSGDAESGFYVGVGDVSIKGIDRYCVIAKDGIGVIANSNATFYVKNDSYDSLQVIAKGLPTSEPSETGQLWQKTITYKNAAGQNESAKVICIK